MCQPGLDLWFCEVDPHFLLWLDGTKPQDVRPQEHHWERLIDWAPRAGTGLAGRVVVAALISGGVYLACTRLLGVGFVEWRSEGFERTVGCDKLGKLS